MLDATLLNNLADLHRQRNDYAAADALFRRSLAIAEALQGPDTYFVSTALPESGIVARERKDYASAQTYYARALAIRERIVGSDHPGPRRAAEQPGQRLSRDRRRRRWRSRRISARCTSGRRSPARTREMTLVSVGNIARTYASQGDVPNALAFQRRADAILETQMSLNLATGSERQKLAFVRSVVGAHRPDDFVASQRQAPGNPDAASLAALVLLQRKGRVQDAMTDVFAAVRQRVADAGRSPPDGSAERDDGAAGADSC